MIKFFKNLFKSNDSGIKELLDQFSDLPEDMRMSQLPDSLVKKLVDIQKIYLVTNRDPILKGDLIIEPEAESKVRDVYCFSDPTVKEFLEQYKVY